jgi:hypothetical protein
MLQVTVVLSTAISIGQQRTLDDPRGRAPSANQQLLGTKLAIVVQMTSIADSRRLKSRPVRTSVRLQAGPEGPGRAAAASGHALAPAPRARRAARA